MYVGDTTVHTAPHCVSGHCADARPDRTTVDCDPVRTHVRTALAVKMTDLARGACGPLHNAKDIRAQAGSGHALTHGFSALRRPDRRRRRRVRSSLGKDEGRRTSPGTKMIQTITTEHPNCGECQEHRAAACKSPCCAFVPISLGNQPSPGRAAGTTPTSRHRSMQQVRLRAAALTNPQSMPCAPTRT